MEKASDTRDGVSKSMKRNTEMIDLTLAGGVCPRRPITYVLPRAMWHPGDPANVSMKGCELAFAASNGTIAECIGVIMAFALRTKGPWVLANFANETTSMCDGLFMAKPFGDGMLIGAVQPCIVQNGAPMILVADDRSHAFAIDTAGKLIDCAVPPPAKIAAGVQRGWGEVRRRMADVVDGPVFRFPSWEVAYNVKHVPIS